MPSESAVESVNIYNRVGGLAQSDPKLKKKKEKKGVSRSAGVRQHGPPTGSLQQTTCKAPGLPAVGEGAASFLRDSVEPIRLPGLHICTILFL